MYHILFPYSDRQPDP